MNLKMCEISTDVDKLKVDLQATFMKYTTIKKWAYIIHDKDDTRPHYHIALHFGGASVDTKQVAEWFNLGYTDKDGVEHTGEQFVERVKCKRWSGIVTYLIHGQSSQQNKYQYSPTEVKANFNIETELANEKILGNFEQYSYAQQLQYVNSLPLGEKAQAFSKLRKLWELQCQLLTLNTDRQIQVVFITGVGGKGKTFYAKKLLASQGYDFCISSSSNDPFQDYMGQKATIMLEFFAYYFYFVISFDVSSLYLQFYKLALDLYAIIDFVPLWAWGIVAIVVLELISRRIAYNRLYHRERRNRGFINERGVVTFVIGTMGAGKTLQITDMSLSTEVQFRDMAFEIILETDMKFPYFPWINFENAIRRAMKRHTIYDLPTCRKFVRLLCRFFCLGFENAALRKCFRRHLKKRYGINYDNLCFGYDYERYGLIYDDKLKLTDIWQALEDYACAYFIYTVQSSLLLANYSVRTDMLFADLGNFPLWNGDFFKRDSRLMDSYSRHAHILDFDMLRLGKQMLEDNPNRNAFGFGVYIISEIDKERKNTPELKEVKANAEECNQKNDLFNVLLKMSRHACVVANRVFIKIFADLQRPTSLGADARELGEIVEIKKKGEKTLALPFFAPFHVFNLFFGWLFGKFQNFYVQYRYNRADNTLFLYCLKSITAKLQHYTERTANIFGSQTLTLEVEDGAREGEVKQCKYFRQSKKIYSKRYSTDCLSGIFETRAAVNAVGLDDLREYADIMATSGELGLQNSHFQTEINKINEVSYCNVVLSDFQ